MPTIDKERKIEIIENQHSRALKPVQDEILRLNVKALNIHTKYINKIMEVRNNG